MLNVTIFGKRHKIDNAHQNIRKLKKVEKFAGLNDWMSFVFVFNFDN